MRDRKAEKTEMQKNIFRAALPGGGAALLCAFFYGRTGNAAGTVTVFLFFTAVNLGAASDLQVRKIPDGVCIGILILAAAGVVTMPEITLPERVWGCLAVSAPMFLLAVLVRGSFGGGDVKLMFACGLFLGWKLILTSFVYAVGIAGIYAVILLLKGKDRRAAFALGPFLMSGMVFAVICGISSA